MEGSHSGLVRAPAKRLSWETGIVGSNPTPSATISIPLVSIFPPFSGFFCLYPRPFGKGGYGADRDNYLQPGSIPAIVAGFHRHLVNVVATRVGGTLVVGWAAEGEDVGLADGEGATVRPRQARVSLPSGSVAWQVYSAEAPFSWRPGSRCLRLPCWSGSPATKGPSRPEPCGNLPSVR